MVAVRGGKILVTGTDTGRGRWEKVRVRGTVVAWAYCSDTYFVCSQGGVRVIAKLGSEYPSISVSLAASSVDGITDTLISTTSYQY